MARKSGPQDDQAPGALPDWTDLLGAETHVAAWTSLLAASRLPPVLLLTGREGLGKRGLLAALAALHFCETGTACGHCQPCTWLLTGRHPEVLWLESLDGKPLLLETAAQLQDHLELSPGPGAKWRIAVIPDADRLSDKAANRLLKTLEEPPPHARILLSTSRLGGILDTVLSRCVRWRVNPPAAAATAGMIRERLTVSGQPAPDDAALDELLREAGLAPGKALRLAGLVDDDGTAGRVDLGALFAPGATPAAVLAEAERLARQEGLPVAALLAATEMELNRSYRQTLSGAAGRHGADALRSRRDLLARAKRLAIGGHVPLNAQLALEALGFAGGK